MATWLGAAIASGENSKKTALQATTEALKNMGHYEHLKLVIVYAWPHYDLQVASKTTV